MKIFISSDMEGTTGIVNWQETELGNKLYDHFSEQMSKEVAAACRGAFAAGAQEVLVKDAHSSARNINPDFLPRGTQILRGWTRNPFSMMAGIDGSFNGVVFTGYHSPATFGDNPLAHTMTGGITWIKINGIPTSELMINGWIAAYFKVPLVCVTGDEGICRQAEEIFPGVKTVPVNKGVGGATISIHPQEAIEKIEATVKSAIEAGLQNYAVKLPSHFEVELRFKEHSQAYYASFYPGVTRLNAHTIGYQTDDYMEFLKMFMFSH
jgi:D-amino peptidase